MSSELTDESFNEIDIYLDDIALKTEHETQLTWIQTDDEEEYEDQHSPQYEHVLSISPETVFMCESLEIENPSHGKEQELCFQSQTDEKTNETESPPHLTFMVTDVRSISNDEEDDESLPFTQYEEHLSPAASSQSDEEDTKVRRDEASGKLVETSEERKLRIKNRAEYKRQQRARETPEQREKRLQYFVEYRKKQRVKETVEEHQERCKARAERYRKRMAVETPAEREKRCKADAVRYRKRLERNPVEQREKLRKYKRAGVTPEEREKRRKYKSEYNKRKRARETSEERKTRLQHRAECKRKLRERETIEEQLSYGAKRKENRKK